MITKFISFDSFNKYQLINSFTKKYQKSNNQTNQVPQAKIQSSQNQLSVNNPVNGLPSIEHGTDHNLLF
jgi:hypothetical protein